ncbi:MAG: hypothetical protein LBG52_07385 [Candidatus Peribacteria bacterium]|jgi:hypothetical protein|nr:hypothetical protein [Candidatus Peribacteria bacterium]
MTKQQAVTAVIVALISLGGLIGFGYLTYQENLVIQAKAPELAKLMNYDGFSINNDNIMPYLDGDATVAITTISELLDIEEKVVTELQHRQQLAVEQNKYYNLFLRHIYLPSLNIWKDPYTAIIDPSLIGQKYLDADPYQDLKLIIYRSDFFRNVGEDTEFNEISDITVGNITDVDGEHFLIPIQLSFIAPNKRSFLLLVNKLSTTSNTVNISLLNEFFFYLIKNIKKLKPTQIAQLRETYTPLFSGQELDEDTIIGYHLYQWTKHQKENILVDDAVIETTITENVLCNKSSSTSECFYKFRDKYRDLPYLAYTIGMPDAKNKTQLFADFLSELPPIISIKDFTFTKVQNTKSLDATAHVYNGTVSINAYGKNISDTEVNDIADMLGQLCFASQSDTPTVLSPAEALQRTNEKMLTLSSNLKSSNVINDLEELQGILIDIETDYNAFNNYQKTIKLFEIFRMLKIANLCNV